MFSHPPMATFISITATSPYLPPPHFDNPFSNPYLSPPSPHPRMPPPPAAPLSVIVRRGVCLPHRAPRLAAKRKTHCPPSPVVFLRFPPRSPTNLAGVPFSFQHLDWFPDLLYSGYDYDSLIWISFPFTIPFDVAPTCLHPHEFSQAATCSRPLRNSYAS